MRDFFNNPFYLQVKWAVYKHYLMNVGVFAAFGTAFTYSAIHCLQIGGNFWLVRWSNEKNMVGFQFILFHTLKIIHLYTQFTPHFTPLGWN